MDGKQLEMLSKVGRVRQVLEGLGKKFDTSPLAKTICHAFIHSETLEAPTALLKGLCPTLKSVFCAVEVTVSQAVATENESVLTIQKQARTLLTTM